MPGTAFAVDADCQVGRDLTGISGCEVDDRLRQVEHVAREEGEGLAVGGAEQGIRIKVGTARDGTRLCMKASTKPMIRRAAEISTAYYSWRWRFGTTGLAEPG